MADSGDYVQGAFTKQIVDNPIIAEEGWVKPQDPLSIDIEDKELSQIVDKRIKDSQDFYREKYDLMNRRLRNEMYYFGRQIADKEKRNELRPYESKNLDNVLYEIQASLKPLAMSRLPDMICIPGSNNPDSQENAKQISKAINTELKKRKNRQVLGLAFKHLPVYFVGIIKARWDPTLPNGGDYRFDVVHPSTVVVDHTCTTSNADDMSFIAQFLPLTVQEMIMRFPEKKKEIITKLKAQGLCVGNEPTWKEMATPIKIIEVWSTWYKKGSEEAVLDTQPPSEPTADKWEKVEGVIWKYDDLVLKKMKNPNYDWQGEEKVFTYDDVSDETTKREITKEDVARALVTGQMPQGMTKEQVYHNYFDMPRKPYFFVVYDQWGKQPLDETSWLEQNIKNQENLDKRGKQINETLDNRGKHVFSKDGGLKANDLERMDLNDPMQDILVDGDVNKVHSYINPERPTAQEFADVNNTRERMYAIAGTSAVRGQLQSDVATTNQIAREADFTRSDDVVEDTINAASEWMSMWSLQFIKLRYTENHLKRLLGSKGSVVFMKLHRDMVEDGMEVMIKSSGTDKIKAQRNAMELAKLGPPYIDPLNFFKDMDMDDPEGRTEQGMTFASDPATYMTKYVLGMKDTQSMVDGLLGQGSATALAGTPTMEPAQATASPVLPSAENTGEVPITPSPLPEGSPRML